MRYATFGYAQIESILATVLRTYLRSARMKGSLVANARKMRRLWLVQGGYGWQSYLSELILEVHLPI